MDPSCRMGQATAEGLNSKIQLVKTVAKGFRNFESFQIAILFHGGKLDMYPEKSAFSHKSQWKQKKEWLNFTVKFKSFWIVLTATQHNKTSYGIF